MPFAPRRAAIGLAAVGLALAAILGWTLLDERRTAWSHAAANATNLLTALRRDVGRTFEVYDLSLQAAADGLLVPGFASLGPDVQQHVLFDGAAHAQYLGSLFVADASGRVTHDSQGLLADGGSASNQGYFTAHRDSPDVGLYVSHPIQAPDGEGWVIAMSRRINGPGGQFAGVVVGTVRFSYFAELFSNLDLGPGSTITAFMLDGTVIYRSPFQENEVGVRLRTAADFAHLPNGQPVTFDAHSTDGGRGRLFSVAKVPNLPFLVSVDIAASTVYAEWQVKAAMTAVVVTLLLLSGAAGADTIRRHLRARQWAESEAVRSAATANAYFDHASDALFLLAVGGGGGFTFERINPACERLTGLDQAGVVGRSPREVFEPDVASAIEARYAACLAAGRPITYDESRVLPAGRRDWHTVISPVRDDAGRITRLVGTARDMTDQNRQAAERQQASKLETVGRLTAGIAHDFNNALQTIAGSLEVIAADYLSGDPDAEELGRIAQSAAAGAAGLTRRLLAFSRQQVLMPQRVDAAALLAGAGRLAAATLGADVTVATEVAPGTPAIHVDADQATTSLLNLILNARDAMPGGGRLLLQATCSRAGEGRFGALGNRQHVVIAVHDSGPGMDDATRQRAFEPFFTTKPFGKGFGLGLSTVQGFCRQSGGDVRISPAATGTRVELWLPACLEGQAAGRAAEQVA